MGYRFLEHMSDQYVEVWGKNLNELFSSAGIAFFETITNTKEISERESKTFEVKGKDIQELLFNFLNKLLFIFDTEKFVGNKFDLEFFGNKVKVKVYGERFDPEKHEVRFEIKGVTLHNFEVHKNEEWKARFLLDL